LKNSDCQYISFNTRLFRQYKLYKLYRKVPLLEEILFYLRLPVMLFFLKRTLNKNNISDVLVIFRGDAIFTINQIIKILNIKPHIFIPDTIDAENDDKYLINLLKRKYYLQGLRNAKNFGAAGETMRDFLSQTYGKDVYILRNSASEINNKRDQIFDNNTIRIVFSGSLYARKSFEKFCCALDYLIRTKKIAIEFIVVSHLNPFQKNRHSFQTKYYRWMEQQELGKLISDCDIAYLPYDFSQEKKIQMTYAFPSKIADYLVAGNPVFFHGPSYSSVIPFVEKYNCGIVCTTMETNQIANDLINLIKDERLFQEKSKNALKAFRNEFTDQILLWNLQNFLNIT